MGTWTMCFLAAVQVKLYNSCESPFIEFVLDLYQFNVSLFIKFNIAVN